MGPERNTHKKKHEKIGTNIVSESQTRLPASERMLSGGVAQ